MTKTITATVSTDSRFNPQRIRIVLNCEGETATVETTYRPTFVGETIRERPGKMLAPRFRQEGTAFVGTLLPAEDGFPAETIEDAATEIRSAVEHYDRCAADLLRKLGHSA